MFRDALTNTSSNKVYLLKQLICMAIIFATVFSAVFSFGTINAKAMESASLLATPGDADELSGLQYDEELGKWYIYNDGVKSEDTGWIEIDNTLSVYAVTGGVVTKKLITNGNIRKFYSASGKNWVLQKDMWLVVENTQYLFGSQGTCTAIYNSKNKQLLIYSNGKMVPIKNKAYRLSDNKLYLFDANGIKVSKTGWVAGDETVVYYITGAGYITHRRLKSGNNYTYAHYDYSKNAWVNEADCWRVIDGKIYYFAESGICTRLYNPGTKRLYVYSGGKLTLAKNNIYMLNDNKWYYFNAYGVKAAKTGWYKINANNYAYVGKYGYVTMKYRQTGNVKKLYQYNYSKNKWQPKSNSWQTIAGMVYNFNKSGVAVLMYNPKAKTCYDYTNKKWKAVKKQVRKIEKTSYLFNAKGKRVSKAGVYKTSDGYIATVSKKGIVTKVELNLAYSRYYTINLGKGKTAKVYGHYDLKAAKKIIKEVNRYRNERHESSLKNSAALTKAANTRAVEISYSYGHIRPDGTLCINSLPILYGENIAAGFEKQADAVWAWKRSQGHNMNMLNSSYKTIAVSVFVAEKKDKSGYKYYYVQAFGK